MPYLVSVTVLESFVSWFEELLHLDNFEKINYPTCVLDLNSHSKKTMCQHQLKDKFSNSFMVTLCYI
jgi:hypothetical protein